ncbi:hypothetical protein LPW26_08035 [Rhodopseudomonas sp. HC1]|uniref:hypothetical protein n=1 Tax=Rhodopseudomonas infernalis TaxID=2897386 RepID=UPI001EE90FD6|nr:hypothetical protein [Rhodopseudomonas infernalis]MCG6204580.1 hypothetical protein [Rhodopseudomonas infernalis]
MTIFSKLISWIWKDLGKLALLLGWALSFALPAWATWAITAFQEWAPLSWIAAGFVGVTITAIFYAVFARARLWLVNASIQERFYQETERINPLEQTFRNVRINVADLVSPIEPIVRGKTFIDCEILGPANAALSATKPGAGSMNGVNFIGCDACKVKDDAFTANGIMFEDCTFLRGKIFRITFFIPEIGYEHVKRSMPGMNWLTPD